MSNKNSSSKNVKSSKAKSNADQRRTRQQQIIFAILAIMIILSWILSMIVTV